MTAPFSPTLRLGRAKVDITPSELTGLNPMGPVFDDVHDAIHLRALVFDDGATQAAMVSLELLEVGLTGELRERIERELGIPADNIVLAPTHTHNAPRVGRTPPGGLSRAASAESLAFTTTVFDKVVDAIRSAQASMVPAVMGVDHGTADVNINRDEFVGDRYVLGQNAEGPSDKTVWVVTFRGTDGETLGVIVNYSVHSTVTLGTGRLSGDLAGAASRYIERRLGHGALALFTLGAVADQNPRVSFEASGPVPDGGATELAFAAAQAQGLVVGAEAVRVSGRTDSFTSAVAVAGAQRIVHFPLRRGENLPPDMTQDDIPEVGVRLSLLTLGEVAFAGVGGEVPTRVYQRLRRASPISRTILISMANERIGYLADDESFVRKTFEAKGSPVQAGHAEAGIVEGLVDLIRAGMGTPVPAGTGTA